MTVTARNTLNQQTSEPLIVSVLDELQAITIIIVGETVVNNQIEFDAYHYKGTNVNYVWNFGDNATANATVSKVRHTYTTYDDLPALSVCLFLSLSVSPCVSVCLSVSVCQSVCLSCCRSYIQQHLLLPISEDGCV